ncbi:phosphoglycerate mutase [Companilactobacillus paralimentarius DSM 13238 = JCM 10415]|jgi:Fructose-2,6-bisphosphatase|uniref:Phosphoglycerate mutase n=1 Tax=Companilactobacillus paralimentarius DSM 13238 = JCM 10415 TaxID=1122151 RepID=A0A0R1PIT3_9LACO|nr:histidine phosphatase family protein [Companilactobacillus paralimentarius]KAE9564029.1 phosphoglycerate mutase [Companilactobacillus paralimentarius]KRL32221.1 phosphoglycerate mutase [Companilactobacillus paralimentarius DSM 13238 = JCM 10415]MDR4933758.1 histidine phosphatase family protein [Companilactobacillus paralimentarius]QFR70196.1 histidine phosphatase family protein [Companilactobacillus paralimentarius]
MELYFVRHGKTQWNLEGKYQGGHGDSPLLSESLHDIGLLAKRLENVEIDHMYSSPLPRARTTAETLIKDLHRDIDLSIVGDLREFDLGIMEGRKFSELEREMPEVIYAFRHQPKDYDYDLIRGESFEEVAKRTTNAVQRIVEANHEKGSVVIVSHGAALVTMIQSLLGTKVDEIRKDGGLSNTSLTHLQYKDGQYKLVEWNETGYLHKKLESSDTI